MSLPVIRWLFVAAILLPLSACVPDMEGTEQQPAKTVAAKAEESPAPISRPAPKPTRSAPPPVMVQDAMKSGTVIVISIGSQQMHVLRNGSAWQSSPISSGKRGKETPTGTFAILQKRKFHRSNLYSNAPMPFMQRLTWDGIAIHAGRLPGYPASHGCIRIPHGFAQELFRVTGFTSTAVIVTNDVVEDAADAVQLAISNNAAIPIERATLEKEQDKLAVNAVSALVKSFSDGKGASQPRMAEEDNAGNRDTRKQEEPRLAQREADVPPQQATSAAPLLGQTIQLTAAGSEDEARTFWQDIKRKNPTLAKMKARVEPATVNGQRYYRLRASSPDAFSLCGELQKSGTACFEVR